MQPVKASVASVNKEPLVLEYQGLNTITNLIYSSMKTVIRIVPISDFVYKTEGIYVRDEIEYYSDGTSQLAVAMYELKRKNSVKE